MGELSRRSGVPIATIKYYLREGLLEPGVATAANQADYGEEHLRRLRLIRALIEFGGAQVTGAHAVIEALGNPELHPHDLLGEAQAAVAPRKRPDRSTPEWAAARTRVEELIAAKKWLVMPGSPEIDRVADALATCLALGVTELVDNLDAYAASAAGIAEMEVAAVLSRRDAAARLELVVLGTVLGEALFGALRMLAHQHESARQLGFQVE
jgi:DNA-binding transcriptional MerR regulator